jgi:hypothetical protein
MKPADVSRVGSSGSRTELMTGAGGGPVAPVASSSPTTNARRTTPKSAAESALVRVRGFSSGVNGLPPGRIDAERAAVLAPHRVSV